MKEYYLDNTGEITFKMDEPIRNPLTDERIAEIMFDAFKEVGNDPKTLCYKFARLIEKEHGIV